MHQSSSRYRGFFTKNVSLWAEEPRERNHVFHIPGDPSPKIGAQDDKSMGCNLGRNARTPHHFRDSNSVNRDSKSAFSLLFTSGSAKLYSIESRTIFLRSA